MSEYVTKDSGERQTFSTGMVRDSAQKHLRPDLLPGDMLVRWAELMGRGAEKYGERNWELAATPEELARFRASAFRHFVQWFYGLDDSEDHAAAVFFNIAGAEHVKARLATAPAREGVTLDVTVNVTEMGSLCAELERACGEAARAMLGRSVESLAALPAAPWAPKVGDPVRVKPSLDHEYGGALGEIVSVSPEPWRLPIRVRLTPIEGVSRECPFEADELEPA